MSLLFFAFLAVSIADTDTDTDVDTDTDSVAGAKSASELAGEAGGCDSTDGAVLGLVGVLSAGLLARRR